jgi:hypothetical protein
MDDEQMRSVTELLNDERSTGESALGFHKSSVVESPDCVPPYSRCSSIPGV